MGKEYDENDDFSVYEADLETEIEQSRRARKKARDKRLGINTADTYKADFEEDTIKVKSTRKKREPKAESFSDKYDVDFEEEKNTKAAAEEARAVYAEDIDDRTDDDILELEEADKEEKIEPEEDITRDEPAAVSAKAVSEDASMKKNGAKRPKKKMSLKKKFFVILCSILGIYAVFVVAFLCITYFGGGDPDTPVTPGNVISTVAEKTKEVVVGKVPDRTIVLLMVIDKEIDDNTGEYLYPRTDAIVLANYDHVNKRLTMMSIPRDTIIEVSDEMYQKMRAEFPEPGKKQMKINAVYHYGGKENGKKFLVEEIGRLFGVKPDYCVCVNFEGFNEIVDSIGGVEFDVPIDMVYDDPAQNLHINLKKGLQVLDGDKAQQFVRYRKDNYGNGYAGGDIERIAVQQAFLKVLMDKALNSETVFKNIFAYMNVFNKYVDTDASINDMARYATVLKTISMSNVVTETLPGEPAYIYGISGYRVDEKAAAAMVYNIFDRPLNEITAELAKNTVDENIEKSDDKKIQVLNGGYTDGMAGEIQRRLAQKGINNVTTGTYDGEKMTETQIYVSREGIGRDIQSCFEKAVNIVVDSEKCAAAGVDIIVVVGIDEPLNISSQSSVSLPADIPLTLSFISGDGSDYSGNSSQNSYSDYTDYDFDDEDDDYDEEYYEEESDESDDNEEADNDEDSYQSDNDDEDNDISYNNDEDNDEDNDVEENDNGSYDDDSNDGDDSGDSGDSNDDSSESYGNDTDEGGSSNDGESEQYDYEEPVVS